MDKENSVPVRSQKSIDQEESLPWIERYRPNSLSELVAQDDIVSTLRKLVEANRVPHLLFYGPPGTGKTSTILAIAKEVYGPAKMKSMVLELNASDARGIDVVRNEIQNFAGTRKLFASGTKLVVLDECDNMTKDAQMALRRVIEKYSANARFCLICNYASKIIPALQSRCTRFRFAPIKTHLVAQRVREIVEKEGVQVTEDGLNAVLKLGKGDMRRILNILQSTALANDQKVTEDAVYRCTGMPTEQDIMEVRDALFNKSVKEAFQTVRNVQHRAGVALLDVITALHEYLMAAKLPPSVRVTLLKGMADIEYALAAGTAEKLQVGALVGLFFKVRVDIEKGLSTSSTTSAMEIDT